MSQSITYVRDGFIEAEKPPTSDSSAFAWIRHNLFASWKDSLLTVIALAVLVYYLPKAIDWLFVSAVWTGTDRTACLTTDQGGQLPAGWSGACWAYVNDRFVQFMFGSYPRDQLWRPLLVAGLFVALLVPFLIPRVPRKGLNALLLLVALPLVAYVLLLGGYFGLRHVETSLWGGLMVTLIISFVGIVMSLPIGILLALGRRSSMPILKMVCIGFIELIRGVPLITVLFMASVLLPLFLEPGNNIDKFLRALIGVSIFASAYMAEVIRGGLQAIPKGQYEAADALGLNYFHKMTFIVLPQAIKLVIPGIVNTFIGMFKDTSLVTIISMYDLLGIVKASFGDSGWITPVTPLTGLIFAGFVFWIFCFGMSRYSAFVERRLDKGHKR
ncbi:ABC transporter permease subunit [Shinella sp. AETb1-6]|jgi:general L-amino acid transport system permease protein|uniref:Amino acid ABC transporter permease n=1 Tax=Shinella sumterensis TaxID=1967501 RepID=A0AA50H974_9HYPH|nr:MULTISPECIES: amino acid ABC transporter permease [Shinella]MCD1264691.1 ABC transporter permease subunit [Shinella sumterensis]MXN52194.1 ABC transporter permease subunit [Shinella sp. AETb1-6]TFE98368.1 amino acid ABC transporter permease [Shinella sumterensis]WLR98821.1 amino acid ABC transporter permease [Shinella sumterensis]